MVENNTVNIESLIDEIPKDKLKELLIPYIIKNHNEQDIIDTYILYSQEPLTKIISVVTKILTAEMDNFICTFQKDENTGEFNSTAVILADKIYRITLNLGKRSNHDDVFFNTVSDIYSEALSLDYDGDEQIVSTLLNNWQEILGKYLHLYETSTIDAICSFIKSQYQKPAQIKNFLLCEILDIGYLGYVSTFEEPFISKITDLLNYLLNTTGPWLFDTETFKHIYDAYKFVTNDFQTLKDTEIIDFYEKWKTYDFIAVDYEYYKLEQSPKSKDVDQSSLNDTPSLDTEDSEEDENTLYFDLAKLYSRQDNVPRAKEAILKYLSLVRIVDIDDIMKTKSLLPYEDWVLLIGNKHILELNRNIIAEALELEDLASNLFNVCEKYPEIDLVKEHSFYLVSKDENRFVDLLTQMICKFTKHDKQKIIYINLIDIFRNLIEKGIGPNQLRHIMNLLEQQNEGNKLLKTWLNNIIFETT